jgi:hypothetical protein
MQRAGHGIPPNLHFPEETPLRDVIKAIHRGTIGKGPGGRGLTIHLDPGGFRAADKSFDAPVTIELEGVPVGTSLGLILRRLGLRFQVRDDGVLSITSREDSEGPQFIDEFEAIEGYQLALNALFWEKQNQKLTDHKNLVRKYAVSQRQHKPRPREEQTRRPQFV